MPITVEKIQTPADDASMNASKTAYVADGGLSASVSSVAVNVYISSVDLTVTAKDATAAANIQRALKERGMEAQTEHDAKTHRLTVRNADAATGMIALVSALGKLGDKPGGISREVADQMIEMELAATHSPPSDRELLKVSMLKGRSGFANRFKPSGTAPSFYIKADVAYELSPVTYLAEDGTPTPQGNDNHTWMGLRNSTASAPVIKALEQSGIKASIEHIDNDSITHVKADAPIGKASTALKNNGLLLASIDTEIQDTVVKARLAAADEQARIRETLGRTAQQL